MISARDTAISFHTPVTCTVLYEKFPFLGRWGAGGGVWGILGDLRTKGLYQEWGILCDLCDFGNKVFTLDVCVETNQETNDMKI